MADDSRFILEIEIDSRNAILGAERLAATIAALNGTLDKSDKNLTSAERSLARFATTTNGAATAVTKNEESAKRLTQSLSTTRYAMFSTGATLGIVSAGLIAVEAATIGTAVAFDRAFANVVRTSDAMRQSSSLTANLRDQFVKMAQEIPVSFDNLTQIGTLGNQLGVQSNHLAEFTKVVAEFSTVTGISAEESATAFGRLDALLPGVQSDFVALGSSILKAGVTSVSTEQEIVNTAVQISSMGTVAGLTADQVVGLSAAFASVGVQPELARGTVTRVFIDMQKAIAGGGEKLKEFSRVAGVSTQEFSSTFGTDKFGAVFLKFMAGLAKEGGNATKVLNDLGITSVRDIPAMLRLANANDSTGKSFANTAGQVGLLTQTFNAAADGFKNKTEIFDQFKVISETVSAKLQVLGNNFQVLLATIGGASSGPFSILVDALTNVLKFMTSIASNPWGQSLLSVVGIAIALAAAVSGVAAAGALAYAGIIGLQQALAGLGIAAEGVGLRALITQLETAGVATRGFGVALGVAKVALVGFQIAAATVGFAFITDQIISAEKSMTGFGGSVDDAMKRVKGTINRYSLTNELSKILDGNVLDAQFSRAFGSNNWFSPVMGDLAKVDEQMAKMVGQGGGAAVAKQLTEISSSFLAAGHGGKEFNAVMTDSVKALQDAGYKFKYNHDGVLSIIEPTKKAADATQQLADEQAAAAEETQKLADGLNWTTDQVKQFVSDFSSGSSGFVGYADALNTAQQRTAEQAAKSAGKGKDAWKDFLDTGKVNMGYFGEALQKGIDDQQQWITDLGILASRGATSFVAGLAPMGPKGAALAHAAVDLSAGELNKLEEQAYKAAFYASKEFASGFEAGFPTLKQVFDQAGTKGVDAYVAALMSGVPGAVDKVISDFQLHLDGAPPPAVKPTLTLDPIKQTLDQFLTTPRNVNVDATALTGDAEKAFDYLVTSPRTAIIDSTALTGDAQKALDYLVSSPRTASFPAKAENVDPTDNILDTLANPRTANMEAKGTNTDPTKNLLNDIAKNRTAFMEAQASNVGSTDATLNNLARPRTVTYSVKQVGGSDIVVGSNGQQIAGALRQATGGYISGPGTATSDSIPARLSNGEYVIKAASVRQYGAGFFDALNRGVAKFANGGPVGYARGGHVSHGSSSGPIMVELSARDRQLLARIPDGLRLQIGNQVIQRAGNAANMNDGTRGSN